MKHSILLKDKCTTLITLLTYSQTHSIHAKTVSCLRGCNFFSQVPPSQCQHKLTKPHHLPLTLKGHQASLHTQQPGPGHLHSCMPSHCQVMCFAHANTICPQQSTMGPPHMCRSKCSWECKQHRSSVAHIGDEYANTESKLQSKKRKCNLPSSIVLSSERCRLSKAAIKHLSKF